MGCPSGPSDEPRAHLARDEDASFASAALPLLLGAMGMTLLAVGLILVMPVLAMAGAGVTVVGFAMHLIVAGMDRAEARARARRREAQPRTKTAAPPRAETPRRGPLADAAVAALTTPGASGGIWPPLSSQRARTAPPPEPAPRAAAKAAAKPVTMWEAHTKVAPPAFHPDPVPAEEGLVEFTTVSAGEAMLAQEGGPAAHPSSGVRVAKTDDEILDGGRDFRLWPGTKDLGAWGHLTGEERTRADARSVEERRAAMQERRARLAARLPTVGAILAEGDHAREPPRAGATRGKCSRCTKFIWAPAERPITLKCPGCGHKARLY